jgi:hypothetical protein
LGQKPIALVCSEEIGRLQNVDMSLDGAVNLVDWYRTIITRLVVDNVQQAVYSLLAGPAH